MTNIKANKEVLIAAVAFTILVLSLCMIVTFSVLARNNAETQVPDSPSECGIYSSLGAVRRCEDCANSGGIWDGRRCNFIPTTEIPEPFFDLDVDDFLDFGLPSPDAPFVEPEFNGGIDFDNF
jgi:hypothetical protein